MIDELHLPVCAAPESTRLRVSLAEYDRWVNDNLRKLPDAQRRQRIDAATSRRPAEPRFRIA